jgi:iron complex transport system permease protein
MSGFISGRGRRLTPKRMAIVLAICLTAAALVAFLAPLVGIAYDRAGRHFELLGLDAFTTAGEPHDILWVRIPRVLAAMVVGGALAGAGCALQALLRNPLADPFTLGISSGSSLAAVLAIRLGFEGTFGDIGVGGAALVGAIGTLVLVSRLAKIGKHLPPATLVLAGVTVSMWCSAASVLIQYTSDFAEVSHMLRWMMGSLDSIQLGPVKMIAPWILGGLVLLCIYARELNALAAGPEAAASVGVAVARTQLIVFGLASVLVGAAIALAGPIGFIGLIVPHTLRAILGPDHRVLLPASILGGAVLLVLCDTIARTITAPAQLPTGAVTAVLGGPLFVAILIRQKQRAAMWGRCRSMSVLRHVIESISPASQAHAEGARQNVAQAGAPMLERLAQRLGGAQHTPRPRAARRTIVVVAGDHGAGDPGVSLGAAHPTVIAAGAIAGGTAALSQVARASHAPILLVDAGAREALPDTAVKLGRGPTKNLLVEPAMTVVDAAVALEAGIALAVSLVDDGLDLVALGAIGIGAEVSAAALLGCVDRAPLPIDDAAVQAAFAMSVTGALDQLAAFGGPETAVLAGLVLGLASMNVPAILDGEATGAAALAAAAFAPNVRGYLIAAHAGSPLHRRILAALDLAPIFEVGLGHGEGTGAAMAIPLVDQVAALSSRG